MGAWTLIANGTIGDGAGTPFWVLAWLVTLPATALVGALAWKGADLLGGAAGASVVFLVRAGLAVGLYVASRRTPVHAGNVNDEWTATKVGAK